MSCHLQAWQTLASEKSLLWFTLCPWQKVESSTVMSLSGCDTVTQVFHIRPDRSLHTLSWLSLVSDVSLDHGWTLLPYCQSGRPSVKRTQDGREPARPLIKVMSCKIEWEWVSGQLLLATLSFIVSARRQTFLLYLFPPVTVWVCLRCKSETAVRWRPYRPIMINGLSEFD